MISKFDDKKLLITNNSQSIMSLAKLASWQLYNRVYFLKLVN